MEIIYVMLNFFTLIPRKKKKKKNSQNPLYYKLREYPTNNYSLTLGTKEYMNHC